MTFRPAFARRLPWFNTSAAVLIILLQRTPALRVVARMWDSMATWRSGEVLRAAFTAAALGTTHSLAGATAYSQTPSNPVRGTVGSPIAVSFGFSGAPSDAQNWSILSGSLPPGTNFVPAPVLGTVRAKDVGVSGTPTAAGNFSVTVRANGLAGMSDPVTIQFEITGAANVAPTISTQPQSQSVPPGSNVTFSVEATGTPTPTYQWTKDGTNLSGATASALTLTSVQAGDAGAYAVVVRNSAGSVTSSTATLTIQSGPSNLAITAQPAAQSIASGGTVVFKVGATGATNFQWRRNGANLPGATNATLVIRSATVAEAGAYSAVVSGGGASLTTESATLTVSAEPDFGRLINLSILSDIPSAGGSFTLGYVVAGGSGTKPILIRAAGPTLGIAPFNVPGVLADPKLELFAGTSKTSENDNWGGATSLTVAFAAVGAFPYMSNTSADAAALASISTGDNSVRISGNGNGTGAVLAELYDASSGPMVNGSTPRLVNVSVLKQISADGSLTAGFVIGGGVSAKTVLIRAIGPALGAAPFNVPGAMADPKLDLFNTAGAVIASNDNWGGDAQLTAVGQSVGAFSIADSASRDAILLITLAPGNYTARVSGVTGGGMALVEVYEVP